ncbi:keratin, type II cytoskeletal 3-like isoform X3 [Stegodyphus dumicola]|uniref:keratin, type II cytoskeletal 3-like isoform X3 n=1 Tax=Stegodyphus dumicola TaxID=202533 RepID=UPI0015B07578|nr:keratin, type II cytoskeletal 3-like isoform X3 [Stegodyphus dumicola]
MLPYGIFLLLFITPGLAGDDPDELKEGYDDYFQCLLDCFGDLKGVRSIDGELCDATVVVNANKKQALTIEDVASVLQCITGECLQSVPDSVCEGASTEPSGSTSATESDGSDLDSDSDDDNPDGSLADSNSESVDLGLGLGLGGNVDLGLGLGLGGNVDLGLGLGLGGNVDLGLGLGLGGVGDGNIENAGLGLGLGLGGAADSNIENVGLGLGLGFPYYYGALGAYPYYPFNIYDYLANYGDDFGISGYSGFYDFDSYYDLLNEYFANQGSNINSRVMYA